MFKYFIDSVDVGILINSKNTKIQNALCTKDFKSVTNTASFSIAAGGTNRSNALYSDIVKRILEARQDNRVVSVKILKDDVLVFDGYLDDSSLKLSSSMLPDSLSINANDKIVDLDKKISLNLVYEGEFTSTIIYNLLRLSGYEGGIDIFLKKNREVKYFVLTEEDTTTYREVIDMLLYELPGGVIYRNPATGHYEIKNIVEDSSLEPRDIHYLVSDKLNTTTSIFDNDGIEITWFTVKEEEREVYVDDSSRTRDSEGNITGVIVKNGEYYPADGDVQQTFQEYNKSLFDTPYNSKQTRLQNADLDLLYVKNAKLEITKKGGNFTFPLLPNLDMKENPSFYPRKAWALFRNDTGSDINLQLFTIHGTGVYKEKKNVITVPENATNADTYESSYIFKNEDAIEFARNLLRIKKHGSAVSTWTEIEQVSFLGEVVSIHHKGTDFKQDAVVVQIDNVDKGGVRMYSVTAIGIGAYTPYIAKVTTTISGVNNATSGKDGVNGYSSASLSLYKWSLTTPTLYDGDALTYHFATGAFIGNHGSWEFTIPTQSNSLAELYEIKALAYAQGETDIVNPSEWSTPVRVSIKGSQGEAGKSIATLTLFKRGVTTPRKPTATMHYNFKTHALSGTTENWVKTLPDGEDPAWAIMATVSGRTDTTSDILATDWSDPAKAFSVGVQGPKGDNAQSLSLYCDTPFFHINSNNEWNPDKLIIKAVTQNIEDPSFSWIDDDNNQLSTALSVTITRENMLDNESLTLTCTEATSGLSSSITIGIVNDGMGLGNSLGIYTEEITENKAEGDFYALRSEAPDGKYIYTLKQFSNGAWINASDSYMYLSLAPQIRDDAKADGKEIGGDFISWNEKIVADSLIAKSIASNKIKSNNYLEDEETEIPIKGFCFDGPNDIIKSVGGKFINLEANNATIEGNISARNDNELVFATIKEGEKVTIENATVQARWYNLSDGLSEIYIGNEAFGYGLNGTYKPNYNGVDYDGIFISTGAIELKGSGLTNFALSNFTKECNHSYSEEYESDD